MSSAATEEGGGNVEIDEADFHITAARRLRGDELISPKEPLIKRPCGRARRHEVPARVILVSSRDFQGILRAFWTPSMSSPQTFFGPLRHYTPCEASRLRFM